jgi:hypothetical protein
MDAMKSVRLNFAAFAILSTALPFCAPAWPQSSPGSTAVLAAPQRDGSHDFDFLIGNWKAHVRRLPDRLVGSNTWIEYDGISNVRPPSSGRKRGRS